MLKRHNLNLSGLEIADRSDRAFFDAHPDKVRRRRALVPGEVPHNYGSARLRFAVLRNTFSCARSLIRAATWSPLAPIFDPELFFSSEGRQQAVSYLKFIGSMMEAFVIEV